MVCLLKDGKQYHDFAKLDCTLFCVVQPYILCISDHRQAKCLQLRDCHIAALFCFDKNHQNLMRPKASQGDSVDNMYLRDTGLHSLEISQSNTIQ